MGYTRKPKTYILAFDDPEYDGLEVEVKGANLGKFLETMKLAGKVEEIQAQAADGVVSEAAIKSTVELIEDFAKSLIAWNLEDEKGKPVPANLTGLKSQDIEFVMYLINSWMEAIGGTEAPLGSGSTTGETSLAASIEMESL